MMIKRRSSRDFDKNRRMHWTHFIIRMSSKLNDLETGPETYWPILNIFFYSRSTPTPILVDKIVSDLYQSRPF